VSIGAGHGSVRATRPWCRRTRTERAPVITARSNGSASLGCVWAAPRAGGIGGRSHFGGGRSCHFRGRGRRRVIGLRYALGEGGFGRQLAD
jgi:hypothetical protein